MVVLTMWSPYVARDANFHCAFFLFEERDANFRIGPMDLSPTSSLLPRSWLFGTCEACSALDANCTALSF